MAESASEPEPAPEPDLSREPERSRPVPAAVAETGPARSEDVGPARPELPRLIEQVDAEWDDDQTEPWPVPEAADAAPPPARTRPPELDRVFYADEVPPATEKPRNPPADVAGVDVRPTAVPEALEEGAASYGAEPSIIEVEAAADGSLARPPEQAALLPEAQPAAFMGEPASERLLITVQADSAEPGDAREGVVLEGAELAGITGDEAPQEEPAPIIREAVFDDETLETFDRLAALLAAEQDAGGDTGTDSQDLISEPQPQPAYAATPPDAEAAGAAGEAGGFEAYVRTYDAARESSGPVLDPVEVMITAEEHPPEETLARLARAMGEYDGHDSERLVIVREALVQAADLIEAQLPAEAAEAPIPEDMPADGTAPETMAEHRRVETVTPDLTEKLLLLLRAIGYDDPHRTLVELVERRGLAFMSQAVLSLQRLSDTEGRGEVSDSWFGAAPPDEAQTAEISSVPLTGRLGKALIAMIMGPDWQEAPSNA